MKEKLKKCLYNNSKLLIGILIGIFCLNTHSKAQSFTPEEFFTGESKTTSWYIRNKELLDEYDRLMHEAYALNKKGRYGEAADKSTEALYLVQSKTALGINSKESFYILYESLLDEEKLEKIREFIIFAKRTSEVFNYLGQQRGLEGKIRIAIPYSKAAVEEIDLLIMYLELEQDFESNLPKSTKNYWLRKKAEYLSMLADQYRTYGAYSLAIKTYKQAIELYPEKADYYVWYGLALYFDEQKSLAHQQWKKALELDPYNIDASKYLSKYR